MPWPRWSFTPGVCLTVRMCNHSATLAPFAVWPWSRLRRCLVRHFDSLTWAPTSFIAVSAVWIVIQNIQGALNS